MSSRPVTLATVRDISHRPVKAEIHRILAETIQMNYRTRIVDIDSARPSLEARQRGLGGLRWFSLPGPDWVAEQTILDLLASGVRRNVEEIVGLEGSRDKQLLRRFRSVAASLRHRHPDIRWRTINATDRAVLVPACNDKRERFDLKTGYDFAWFDYCAPLSDAMLCSISLIGQAAPMFERAWRRKRPGLLFITLQAGMDRKTSLNALDWLNANLTIGDEPDRYRYRANALTALLNRNSQPMGYTCIPTQWVFYREKLDNRRSSRMYLLGYEVWQGDYDYEPELRRVVERRFHL